MDLELKMARQISKSLMISFNNLIPHNKHESIQELVNSFGNMDIINRIHIIDENGIIRKSNQSERIGAKSIAKGLPLVLEGGKEVVEEEFKEKENLWLYSLIIPIKNEKACYDCHGKDKKILGALRLGFHFWSFKQIANQLVSIHIIIIAFGIVLTFVLIRLFLRRSVIRPLEELLKTTQKITQGDLKQRMPVFSEDEIGRLSSNFNALTEKLKITLEEAVQSTKMKTLGLLSAAVFHDLIGSITGIRGYARFILGRLNNIKVENNEDLLVFQNQIASIEKVALNCERIIEYYYIFSGKSRQKIGEVNINEVIEEALGFFRGLLNSLKIEAGIDSCPGLPQISGNRQQLLQVFINIILNALEAMPKGGRLNIKISVAEKELNKYIIIAFTDTGSGISAEDLKKIATPFFTTKEHLGNIGLGLLIVKQVIEAHGGSLKIESQLAKGTTVFVELPVEQKEANENSGN